MTAWYDENGHLAVQNAYDEEGRVLQQTDGEGGTVILAMKST